jgi:hypothetical protein
MIEGTPIMHINLVIVLEMGSKGRDVTSDRALRPSIRAAIWTKSTVLLMLELAVVWENIKTS